MRIIQDSFLRCERYVVVALFDTTAFVGILGSSFYLVNGALNDYVFKCVICIFIPGWGFTKLLTQICNIFPNFKMLLQSSYS